MRRNTVVVAKLDIPPERLVKRSTNQEFVNSGCSTLSDFTSVNRSMWQDFFACNVATFVDFAFGNKLLAKERQAISTDANQPAAKSPRQPRLMPWLRLLRLPTVFTALANVLCGFYVSSPTKDLTAIVALPWFWLLLIASAGLYLGGMVFNDVFDAELDARERPERPIPSKAISKTSATILGTLLMVVGVGAAWMAGSLSGTGTTSVTVAVFLVAVVILYDALLKSTWLGPLGMGTCRFLNVILGASCCGGWDLVWGNPQRSIAFALGVYVFGVTWFARNEAVNSSRPALAVGVLIAIAGIGINASATLSSETPNGQGASIALGLIAANVIIRCVRAIKANQPILLQKTVGFMLLNIVFMDAAMVFFATGSGRLATTVVILVIPATLMKRFIPLS